MRTEYRAAKQTTTAKMATNTKNENKLMREMIGRCSNCVDPSRGKHPNRAAANIPIVAH